MSGFVLFIAVVLGASAWGVVWKERYSTIVGLAWSATFGALAGALTGNLTSAQFWIVMAVLMYLGGLLLRALRIF